MHFEDFRTWHWVVIGLLVGALFSGIFIYRGPQYADDGRFTMEQMRFEHALMGRADRPSRVPANIMQQLEGTEILQHVVVHPPMPNDSSNTYWVTGEICSPKEENQVKNDPTTPVVWRQDWTRFLYKATVPYQPLPPGTQKTLSRKAMIAATQRAAANAAKNSGAAAPAPATKPAAPIPQIHVYKTVVEYLAQTQHDPDAHFSFRFAWQEHKLAVATLPPLAGLLVIGIAWPMTLNLMVGAGLARKPQPRVKLPKRRKTDAMAKVVDHTAGDKQLDELNAALEERMAGFVVTAAAVDPDDSRAGVPVVKPLAGGGAVVGDGTKAESDEVEVKEFGGEFYPVVKSVHKEHRHADGEEDPAKTAAAAPSAPQKK